MRAEVEQLLGETDRAVEWLRVADGLDPLPDGMQALHYHSIRASVLLAAGRTADAWKSLERADGARRSLLAAGPSYASWESVLRQWHHLDVRAVHAALEQGRAERALLLAEAAKGRVTAWLGRALDRDEAAQVLDPARQDRALERARGWAAAAPGRALVSLFAGADGLAVLLVDGTGQVQGTWIEEAGYDRFREDGYEPWVDVMERALDTGDEERRRAAGRLTLNLLDQVGAWLERAAPALAAGGSELVVVPHRLFRNLPLAHLRLSTARLVDLFDSVVIAPTLTHLVPAEPGTPLPTGREQRWALADADGSLPLARCEALLTAPSSQLRLGPAATKHEALAVLARAGFTLLSLHGRFDPDSPLDSELEVADGRLCAVDLLQSGRGATGAVLLGACEAGMSRRSVSDEPWSFPTLLLQAGAPAALAPLWRVDDLAVLLLGSRLVEALDEGLGPGPAVGLASRWLRQAAAPELVDRLDDLLRRLSETGKEGLTAANAVCDEVDQVRRWLSSLGRDERPYDDPLDWAAFQVWVGAP